jgi:hypothetical protein
MSDIVAKGARLGEDKRLDRLPASAQSAVLKVDRHPMEAGKASIGAAVKSAVGDDPLRVYGDEAFMSKVISGEKVPDYLGRIASRPAALRRYALSLLKGDPNVRIRTTVDWDEEKVG